MSYGIVWGSHLHAQGKPIQPYKDPGTDYHVHFCSANHGLVNGYKWVEMWGDICVEQGNGWISSPSDKFVKAVIDARAFKVKHARFHLAVQSLSSGAYRLQLVRLSDGDIVKDEVVSEERYRDFLETRVIRNLIVQ